MILIEFEMKMRAGASACRAHIADDLTFLNRYAVTNPLGELVEMRITGQIRGVMLYVDRLTIAAVPARLGNHPVTYGTNRSSPLRGKIHAGVG